MSYFIMGVLAGLVLIVAGVFTTGYEVGRDRRRQLADLQARLERTARAQAWVDEQRLPVAGPFPVDTEPLLLLSDSMAAGVALEREIRDLGQRASDLYGPTP